MDIGWITNNIGAIVGGFVVIAVAYFLFRPRTNNNQSEKGSRDSVSEEAKKNATKESVSLLPESDSDKETSPLWKTRRYMLNKIRSLKKPDILSEKNRGGTVRDINSEEDLPPAMVNIPAAEPVGISPETHEENLDDNPVIEIPNENIPEITLPVTIDDNNSISNEIENTDVHESTDDDDSPEIDMNAVPTPDETEEIDNNQLEVAVMDYEQLSEKPEGGSDVFSLFSEEDEEENEVSKFASNLDQVDVNNLLKEAENIQKYLRR